MATLGSDSQPASGGGQSNPGSLGLNNAPLNRGLERALEEAANSGLLNLSARKLKEFPRSAMNHDLSDTVQADLSKNRLTEIPIEVCNFVSLEVLNLYHNCIKVIPDAIASLQMLTYLNLSRNQLSALPVCLCGLPLKVLIASNNKLCTLPEELGQLKDLMELDISCNEITALPQQIGQLRSLRELNIRRNYIKVLPEDLAHLPLVKFDFSCNKVEVIPLCFRKMTNLQILQLDNNPLQSPPAQICIKGKVHIFKYLSIEACRLDKTAESSYLPVIESMPQHAAGSTEDIDQNKKQDTDSGVGSDNGDKRLSATEPSDEDTISLNAPMTNITEEEGVSKDVHLQDSDHLGLSLNENNNSEESIQSNYEYGECTLSTPFVNYMKARSSDFDEPLRIDEDQCWITNQITPNSANSQEIPIEMINQLREAVELLQDPNRLNMNIKLGTGDQIFSQAMDLPDSPLNGQMIQGLPRSYQNESTDGKHEFQKRREMILEKARHEAQLACQQYERQIIIQHQCFGGSSFFVVELCVTGLYKSNLSSDEQNDMRRDSLDGGDDDSSASSPTMNSPPFGLRPRSDMPISSSPPTSLSPITQALPRDKDILSTPTEGDMKNGVFTRSPRTLESIDPQFTMRRKMEQMREELELMEQLRESIESRLKVTLPDDLGSSLMDGVVLCHLVNHIRPRSVASIHVPSPAVPKLSMAKCRRNVENFLEACRKMGVPEEKLCLPHHILEEKGLVKVSITVQALIDVTTTKQALFT
ncbi:leucine-rich repeat and calponin homology domain-containing protein 1 isoform X3 [Polypterus senegalus]|uniref:leucine-rich repeat and calponin homology domain-containing protein 1 isoform X3 n=1 Tax=Polypterus senegalus TaxID=55291 RepID=UPI001962659E|nr:leucine-rich repeat and calponin homology domain-containing protein 1 isoform X3 [Polypterus senegalus]